MSSPAISNDDRWLQALYQMSIELTALQPLDSVLGMALEHCLVLTDSEFGFVGLVTEKGDAMDVVAVQGFRANGTFYEKHHLIPLRPNIFARVVLENRSVRSVDARYDRYRVGQPEGHSPVLTFLGVPLRHRDKPIGMVGVANRPEPYEQDDEHSLMPYAAQIAIVITSNRTREIHDALKRRCIYHWIDYPSFEKNLDIVQIKFTHIKLKLAQQIVAFIQLIREQELFKAPGRRNARCTGLH